MENRTLAFIGFAKLALLVVLTITFIYLLNEVSMVKELGLNSCEICSRKTELNCLSLKNGSV